MSLGTLRPHTQIILAVVLPLCCIALGTFLVWPPVSGLRQVRDEIEATQHAIEEKQSVIMEAEAAAEGRPLALAVAARDEQEPIVFLRQLSALAAESHVTLAGIRSTRLPPVPAPRAQEGGRGNPSRKSGQTVSPAPAAVGGQRPVLPHTVSELTDEVTVEGTFASILSLLVRIETFERILSVSKCRITGASRGGYPRLRAVFTLSRFRARPGPPPGANSQPQTTERR